MSSQIRAKWFAYWWTQCSWNSRHMAFIGFLTNSLLDLDDLSFPNISPQTYTSHLGLKSALFISFMQKNKTSQNRSKLHLTVESHIKQFLPDFANWIDPIAFCYTLLHTHTLTFIILWKWTLFLRNLNSVISTATVQVLVSFKWL